MQTFKNISVASKIREINSRRKMKSGTKNYQNATMISRKILASDRKISKFSHCVREVLTRWDGFNISMIEADNGIVQFRDRFDNFYTGRSRMSDVHMMTQRFETFTDRMWALTSPKRAPNSAKRRLGWIGWIWCEGTGTSLKSMIFSGFSYWSHDSFWYVSIDQRRWCWRKKLMIELGLVVNSNRVIEKVRFDSVAN